MIELNGHRIGFECEMRKERFACKTLQSGNGQEV